MLVLLVIGSLSYFISEDTKNEVKGVGNETKAEEIKPKKARNTKKNKAKNIS